jgi:hypothetical protein
VSTQSKRMVNEERFTYSWYLPVAGGKGSGRTQTAQLLEKGAESVKTDEGDVGSASMLAQQIYHPKAVAVKHKAAFGSILSISPSKLKLVAFSGWSIISGAGIVLLVTQSPVLVTHVLALGGVWVTVSALIWYLPGKLTR